MRLRIAPKHVTRVSTVLTLSASLIYASVFGGGRGVNTGARPHNRKADEMLMTGL